MDNARRTALVITLGLALMGCGSDDGGGGSGGSSGSASGGAAGSASGGSSGSASGGSSGSASGGSSGSGSGGSSGSASGGSSGSASGGAAGSASGGAGGMAGAAGAAGTPGTGGTSGSGGSSFGPSSSRLVKHPIGTKYANQGYWEYLPPNPPAKSPLLVALHGVGENGSGDAAALDDLTTSGIPKLLKKDQWPNSRPFIVVAPQHAGSGCPGATEVYDFIDFASKNYGVDLSRVYLTGLSCGAIGGWGYLNKYLDQQVAAFVSIAGNGTGAWNNRGCELGKVPIWAFHGDADPTVNVSGSKVPLEGLMKCPSPPLIEAKLTIYPGVKHDSWTKTYDLSAGHDIYAWMLKFKHP